MVRSRVRNLRMVSAALLVVAAGCSSEPQVEISDAQSALRMAEESQADVYAPQEMHAAQQLEVALLAERDAQQGRLAPFRRWGETEALAARVEALADSARTQAQLRKQELREETAAAITEVRDLVTEVQHMIDGAPTGKGSSADLQILRADLQAIAQTLGEADRAFSLEQYELARQNAESARMTAHTIRTTIEEAHRLKAASRPVASKS